MKKRLAEEIFKFRHQPVAFYGTLAFVILLIYTGLNEGATPQMLALGFGTNQWLALVLFALSSSIFAMEYQHGTILMLVYKSSSRLSLYLAKFLVVFLYSVLLAGISLVVTFGLKIILIGGKYSWVMPINGRQSLLTALLLNLAGTLIYGLFIISLAFMLLMLVKLNAAVVGIGFAIGFIGASLSRAFIGAFPQLSGIAKWNPLNMIFVSQQLADPKYARLSLLSNSQIILATILYALLFIVIGFNLFKRRRV